MVPEMIVMLTNNDKTVPDAQELFDACKHFPANTWGFKDVGIEMDAMKKLAASMKAAGKTVYIENIERDEASCLKSADITIECGADFMSGGQYFDSVRDKVHAAGLGYVPAVGELVGRPAHLSGTIEEIVDEAKMLNAKGVQGMVLANYRYDGDPIALAKAVVASGAKVCIAGSVDSFQRLDEVVEVGADTFTIGSAFFANKFGDDFPGQVKTVLDYLAKK